MQKLLNFSQFALCIILGCCILLVWQGEEMAVINPPPVLAIEDAADQAQPQVLPPPGPTHESIWKTMRNEFQLDTRPQSARVQAEIRKLLAEPNHLVDILRASIPYIYYIHEQTLAHGLPAELALIPVIESEFNPDDKSNKGATGLWQLMRQTAHELGVKVHGGYDGRRNVVTSTKAALAYFKDLGNMFHDNWLLAIAAYNCGQGRVQSAMRKTGSNSFWNLPLPRDTKYYVPRLLAVAEIIKNPAKYGVTLPQVKDKPYFQQITVKKPVHLAKVAETTGINLKTLQQLNPDFTKGSHPSFSEKTPITLLVPVDKAVILNTDLQLKT